MRTFIDSSWLVILAWSVAGVLVCVALRRVWVVDREEQRKFDEVDQLAQRRLRNEEQIRRAQR